VLFSCQKSLRQLLSPIYRRLETTVHPLRYLFVEITQRCNLRCRHCGSDCSRDTQRHELSVDEWIDFFAYLKNHFDHRKLILVITGGEPFCHPDLGRLLDGLTQNDLPFGMVTNGFALSQANLDRISAAGIRGITVSLDGMEDSHDWLRGVNGSFRHAIEGIQRVVKLRLPLFDVVTCVNPRNLSELPQMLALLRDLGVPAWRLFSIFPRGRAKKNPELLLDKEKFLRMLDFIGETREKLHAGALSVQFSCEGFLPAAIDRHVRDEPYFCRAGISIGGVLCDGSITACPNLSRSLIQGNIRNEDFTTIWEKRFAPFRERSWMRQGPCLRCHEWKRCLGNSMHLWDEASGQTARCTWQLVHGRGRL
jgi:radical SAM enzyme (rSAM/lipoprotein system)